MYVFTVCVGVGQFVYMLDGENIIGLHHKIPRASFTVSLWKQKEL